MLRDQRGIALPMAMIALLIMAALIAAFSALSATEPTLASNQLRVAQARALAETGLERALWALTAGKTISPPPDGALAYPLPATVPPPYDGSQLIPVSAGPHPIGGFRLTVAQGARANERSIVAVGWVPTDTGADGGPRAHQRITATLMDFGFNVLNLPCAFCTRGDLQLAGAAAAQPATETRCGERQGTWSGRMLEEHALTHTDLDALKAYARAAGTYYRGAVTFSSANRAPNGLIFVDTPSGRNIDPASTPPTDYASVSIQGDASADPSGFKGWIIVNGSIEWAGTFHVRGMLYAADGLRYRGTGRGSISGQVISANVTEPVSTFGDSVGTGSLIYSCADARSGGGAIPQTFLIKSGTYRETPDS